MWSGQSAGVRRGCLQRKCGRWEHALVGDHNNVGLVRGARPMVRGLTAKRIREGVGVTTATSIPSFHHDQGSRSRAQHPLPAKSGGGPDGASGGRGAARLDRRPAAGAEQARRAVIPAGAGPFPRVPARPPGSRSNSGPRWSSPCMTTPPPGRTGPGRMRDRFWRQAGRPGLRGHVRGPERPSSPRPAWQRWTGDRVSRRRGSATVRGGLTLDAVARGAPWWTLTGPAGGAAAPPVRAGKPRPPPPARLDPGPPPRGSRRPGPESPAPRGTGA